MIYLFHVTIMCCRYPKCDTDSLIRVFGNSFQGQGQCIKKVKLCSQLCVVQLHRFVFCCIFAEKSQICMPSTSLHRIFGQVSDPRIKRKKKHLLIDIVILSVLAVLSGVELWDSIELYGHENLSFLKQILRLPNVPSHDTINRVFGIIDWLRRSSIRVILNACFPNGQTNARAVVH